MKKDTNKKGSSSNFGLSIGADQIVEKHSDNDYDNLFGLSKSEQRLKKKEREMELEQKRANIIATQQILSEQIPQQTGMDTGKLLLYGGLILLVCFGAYQALKKKPVVPAENIINTKAALTV